MFRNVALRARGPGEDGPPALLDGVGHGAWVSNDSVATALFATDAAQREAMASRVPSRCRARRGVLQMGVFWNISR